MRNWHGDELQRFGPSFRPEPIHVHFRPHRWNWGSAAVGWALGVAMICGIEWLHAHGSGWALGFWGALLAMYPLWLIAGTE